jgi:DNA-binding winged helix-turn-helix (wHTH) protein/tetratricopeptide (TPR) repeat protein
VVRTVPDKDAGPTSPSPSATRFRVGDVEVAPETGAISGPGGHAALDPKVMSVLACLAGAGGRLVTRDRLMESVWPGVVVTDFALSRCIYQLRKTLGEVSAASSSPIETLPKRGYRLTWAVTDVESAARVATIPGSRVSSRSVAGLILTVAVIVATLYAYGASKHWFGAAPAGHSVRVSVLPLDDISKNADQAVFVNGLSREIMHAVAAIPGVVAVGQQSVFELVTAGWPMMDTAARLDADFVISGIVTPVGDARRVLIDVRSVPEGKLLWSHAYLVDRNAPFVMLTDLAQSVATVLDFSANPGRSRGSTRNLAAFEAYIAAGEAESREASRQLLLRSVQLDPEFAEAWDRLAAMEVMPVWNGQTTVEDAWHRAKPYLDRAFALDPDLPSAHVTLGRFQRERGDTDGAIASFRRALELDPGDGWASANLGLVLRFTGRYDEALTIHDTAVAMDPLSPAAQTRLATSYWFVGDFESAARHYQTAMDLDPTYNEVYDSWSGMLSAGLGRFDEALEMMRRKMSLPGEPTARTLAAAGALCSLLGMDSAAADYWQRSKDINPAYRRVDEERLRHYLARGDDEKVGQIASAILDRDPGNDDALLALAIIDVGRGDAEAFSARVREAYPAYFIGSFEVDANNASAALLVALADDAEGRQKEAQMVLQAVQKALKKPRAWQHLILAAASAMRGRAEQALRHLRSSPPGRVRGWAPVMMRDPRFASLRNNSEFQALVGEHMEEIRLQRSREAASLAMQ